MSVEYLSQSRAGWMFSKFDVIGEMIEQPRSHMVRNYNFGFRLIDWSATLQVSGNIVVFSSSTLRLAR